MNSNLKRRSKKAEQKLKIEQKPLVLNVTHYASSGPLPPDIRQGNMLVHFVRYEPAQAKNMKKEPNET